MPAVLDNVVVVGGGLAGARCVEELHSQGFDGQVTLITAEDQDPYDRPPLSKAFLTADRCPEVRLPYDLSTATVLHGWHATGLTHRAVETEKGTIPADAVIIATGAEPIRLPGAGPQDVLRTHADAVALRSALTAKPRVVVIGASWLGAEVAGAARALGCSVTCVEAGPAPLHQTLGNDLGARTIPWWSGIEMRLSQQVARIEENGVVLSCGRVIAADLVITAVGVRPAVSWLAGSDIPVDRGVLVNQRLLADLSPAHPWYSRVAAVGDVAAWTSHRYCTRLRVEHWDNARLGPKVAVAAVLGHSEPIYDPIPYFWSEQLGHRVQYLGHHDETDQVVIRDTGSAWGAGWLSADGSLRAFLSVDQPRDVAVARRLIESRAVIDARRLGDPGSALQACAA